MKGNGPLSGIRVLDLTHVLNGPFCTMLLAHMGADVIKVEHGAGDRYRHSWMPPGADRDGYESLAVNANKRFISLNLKSEQGRRLFFDLASKSDVLVENFAVGTTSRLGIDYDAVKEINPRIIYASSNGYGSDGPYARVPAFAPTVMAIAGWMGKSWELSGTAGTRVLGIGDEAAGVSLALGVCAALYKRELTGEGERIEVAMQEALMGFMVSSLHTLFEGQEVGGRVMRCRDGYVSFHLPDMNDERFDRLAEELEHVEATSDPRFCSPEARRKNFGELQETLARWISDVPRDEFWQMCRRQGIAAAPVLSVAEAVADENMVARRSFVEVDHPKAGKVKLLRPWIRFRNAPTGIWNASRNVGEDNRQVYSEMLGLIDDEVERLAKEDVIS